MKQGMTPLFGEDFSAATEAKKRQKQAVTTVEEKKVDPIEEMVEALFDPIIVFPGGGWENDLPENLRKRLPLDRLAHIMRCINGEAKWDEACDLEALLYMYPRTLFAPLGEQWTRIYLYLGTKCMGDRVPEDIKQDKLSDYDMAQLRDLKRWIQAQKVKVRKERRRQDKAQDKPREESAQQLTIPWKGLK